MTPNGRDNESHNEPPLSLWSEWRGKVTASLEDVKESLEKVDGQLAELFKLVHGLDNRLVRQETRMALIGVIAGAITSGVVTLIFRASGH
jgi:hypothetical protein